MYDMVQRELTGKPIVTTEILTDIKGDPKTTSAARQLRNNRSVATSARPGSKVPEAVKKACRRDCPHQDPIAVV